MVSKVVSLYARIQWMGAALGLTLLAPASANAAAAVATPPAQAPTTSAAPSSSNAASSRHASSHHRGGKKALASTTKHAPKKDASKGEKQDKAVPETAASKEVPRQSSTPLPTIAAAIGTPLAVPIDTHVEATERARAHRAERLLDRDADAKGHAREPRRTPILVPTRVSTHPSSSTAASHKAAPPPKPSCLSNAIDVMRGTEEEKVTLTKCDGSVAPLAVESMSIMVRPGNAAKPAAPVNELAKKSGTEIAPGIRRIDGRLVERLQSVIDHFAKSGVTPKVFVISGVRPAAAGSFHANGRALDFRIDGVKNEDLVAFCKTMPDTGCGFYPNSSFIHIDVRDAGTGHVSWIDSSAPGETPKYVAVWPPPKSEGDTDLSTDPAHLLAKLDTELQLLPPPVGEVRPDTGSKSDLAGHGHDETPPAMLEKEIDERGKP